MNALQDLRKLFTKGMEELDLKAARAQTQASLNEA